MAHYRKTKFFLQILIIILILKDVHRFADNICRALDDIKKMFEQYLRDHPPPPRPSKPAAAAKPAVTNGTKQ